MASNISLIGDEETLLQIINDDFSETDGRFEDDLTTTLRINSFRTRRTLLSVFMPNVTSIGNRSFYDCTGLREGSFPKCTSTGTDLFYNCYSLANVDLGSISTLESNTFTNCYNITDIVLRNTSGVVGLSNNNRYGGSLLAVKPELVRVFVPRSLITDYQQTSLWSTLYASNPNLFKALEDYTVDGTVTGEMNWSLIDVLPTPVYSLANQEFNGTSDYIDTNIQLYNTANPEYTIVCDFDWPKQTSDASIFACYDSNSQGLRLYANGTNGAMKAYGKIPGTSSTINNNIETANNNRYQVSCTVKGGMMSLVIYKDNIEDKFLLVNPATPTGTISNTLLIGRDMGHNAFYKGTMHSLKVFNKALNARQVRTVLGIV